MAIYSTSDGIIKLLVVEPCKVMELVELLYGDQDIYVPPTEHRLVNVVDLTKKNVVVL